jgi:hypothetical protein
LVNRPVNRLRGTVKVDELLGDLGLLAALYLGDLQKGGLVAVNSSLTGGGLSLFRYTGYLDGALGLGPIDADFSSVSLTHSAICSARSCTVSSDRCRFSAFQVFSSISRLCKSRYDIGRVEECRRALNSLSLPMREAPPAHFL